MLAFVLLTKMNRADSPLHALTLREAASGLRSGHFTALDLMQSCLDRIEALDDTIHAVSTLCADQALEAAGQATRLQREGQWIGPLHGIPITHKDVFLTRGLRTTANSHVFADWLPGIDAETVVCFNDLGAITLGKAVCHEFAFGAPDPGDLFPAARNPWDLERMPGSSSSGSGAAVAAGFCPIATGTDTGGSVRHPAAACGVVGLKPTRGRFSSAGVIALAPSLDTVGWLTRDVADQAFIWPTLSVSAGEGGSTSRFPSSRLHSSVDVEVPALAGLRIGVPRDWLDPDSEWSRMHDPEIREAFEDARMRLVSLGIEWVPIDLPPIGEIIRAANQIICTEAAQQVGRWLHAGGPLGAGLRKRLLQSSADDLESYHRSLAYAERWRRDLDRLFDQAGIALIATPGREHFPETLESLMQSGSGPRTACNRLYSLTGHPALTMPMGLGAAGLPMAIQFAARAFDEASLIAITARLEREGLGLPQQAARPWE